MYEYFELERDVDEVQLMDNYEIGECDGKMMGSLMMKKKRLTEIVKDLNRFELLEIFQIFKTESCAFSENSNGIFINITHVSENIIDKVYHFIDYIKEKKKELVTHEQMITTEKEKIKDVNKLNEENYDNYIFNKNFINQIQENKNIEILSESDEEIQYQLEFSSEDDDDLENKMSLKKKKVKYTGTKAKIIKSYKETKDSMNQNHMKKKTTKEKEVPETEP
jgi:hypothetical protein